MERHYSDLLVKLVWFEGLCWSISTSSPDPRLVFSVCDPIEPQNHKPAGVGGTTCCVDPVMCFKGLLTDVTSWWEKLSVLSRWGWWSAVQVTSPQGTSRPSRPTVQLSGAALIQWAGTEVNTGVTDLPPQTRRFCPTAWRLADELAVICVSHILSFSVKLWRLPPERFLMDDWAAWPTDCSQHGGGVQRCGEQTEAWSDGSQPHGCRRARRKLKTRAAWVASRRKPAGEMETLPVSPRGSRDLRHCNASWVRSAQLSDTTTSSLYWSEFSQIDTETKTLCWRFSPKTET